MLSGRAGGRCGSLFKHIFIIAVLTPPAACSATGASGSDESVGDARRRQQQTSLRGGLSLDVQESFAYNSSDFARAVANQSVDVVWLASPRIDMDEVAWTASGAELPIVRTRNLTISGDPRLLDWPVLNFNNFLVKAKMRLADGVTLNFTGVVAENIRSDNPTRVPGLDVLLPTLDGETATLSFVTAAIILPACFPLGFRQDDGLGLPRLSKYPGVQSAVWTVPQDGCIGSASAPVLQRCWPDKGVVVDFAVAGADAVDLRSSPVPNNIDFVMRNVPMFCSHVLDPECLRQQGPVLCFLLAVNKTRQSVNASSIDTGLLVPSTETAPARSSNSSPAGMSRGSIIAVVVGSVVGAAVMALIVAAAVVVVRRGRRAKGGPHQRAPPEPLVQVFNTMAEDDRHLKGMIQDGPFTAVARTADSGDASPRHRPNTAPPSSTSQVVRLDVPLTPLTPTRADFCMDVQLDDDGPAAETRRGGRRVAANQRRRRGKEMASLMACEPASGLEQQVPPSSGDAAAGLVGTGTGMLSGGSTTSDGASDPPPDSGELVEGDRRSGATSGVVKLLGGVCGQGAFGRVVEGMYGGQKVAVKLMAEIHVQPGAQPSHELLKSFKHEVEILGRCQHPNIVRLLAACLEPPRLFLVLELMETSLDRAMYKNPAAGSLMPLAKVLHIGIAVADALAYLHPTIVHRDLKPGNVLVNEPGSDRPIVKLTDFGLSRLRVTMVPTENPDAGTPAYMAPECFDINNNHISHKADIYSLGVLLWEMLAGRRPWAGLSPLEVALVVIYRGKRLSPDELDAARCSSKIRRLLKACWDSDPERRPAAAEVAKELTLALQQVRHLQPGEQ